MILPLLNVILIAYCFFCFFLIYYWLKIPKIGAIQSTDKNIQITLIVPVRNEEKNLLNLLHDLENQSIAKELFEVIIANDNSSDTTADLVKQYIKKSNLNLKLIDLPEPEEGVSPKKRAITQGIQLASGRIILSTDGDCRVGEKWIIYHLNAHNQDKVMFVSAPVFLKSNHQPKGILERLWNGFQEIEFGSLIISGAASISAGWPNMCSGANISYKKSAFQEVNGFEGNLALASGDDEFLMHKIHIKYPKGIRYLKSKDAIVYTEPITSLKTFFNQRKRWSSKWNSYEINSPKIVAAFIFASNFAYILALFSNSYFGIFIKTIPEFLFLLLGLNFSKNLRKIVLIPILQIIYPFYVVLFALVSLKKNNFIWKDRVLK